MRTPHIALRVEALEGRDCPATANLFNGVLTVVGADGGESITVTQTANGKWIEAAGQVFAAPLVSQLVITGGNGDDYISNRTRLGAVIYGGEGNDTLLGGPGDDTIYGGQGDDTILGRRGDDTLVGGAGTNTITAGPGNDTIISGDLQNGQSNTAIESQIIQLINNYRVSNGLVPLAVNVQLNTAADMHSQDMVAISNGYGPWTGMQHELFGTLHPEVTDRLDAAGFDDWSSSFDWGENIAFGYNSAADVVNAWLNSPEHLANIMNPNFTQTGVGVEVDASGRLFFTQDFGNES